MTPTIYGYWDPRAYLRDVLKAKQQTNPLFSLRAWSKQMGFRCHSSLVILLNGKRKIRPEHLEKISRGLRLSSEEESYLRALVHFASASSATEKDHYEAQLKLLTPSKDDALLDHEKFRTVADWIHMAILEMTKLKDFKGTPEFIAKRLKFHRPMREIEDAIQRLIQLGLVARQGDQLVKTNERLTTPRDRASESIREHHKQVLMNAHRAVDEQSVDERILNSCTMTIDSKRINEAKELILRFRADMAKLMETDGGDETYQLSVQFYKLTETNPHIEHTEAST